jgi:hypothetical protein
MRPSSDTKVTLGAFWISTQAIAEQKQKNKNKNLKLKGHILKHRI